MSGQGTGGGGGVIIGSNSVTPVPVIPAGQTTWFGRAVAWLKGEVSTGLSALTDFMQHQAFPFLENLFKQTALDEINALKPLAEEALTQFMADLPKIFTDPGAYLGMVQAVTNSTLQKAEAVGLNVAESSILMASTAAVHNWIATNAPATGA